MITPGVCVCRSTETARRCVCRSSETGCVSEQRDETVCLVFMYLVSLYVEDLTQGFHKVIASSFTVSALMCLTKGIEKNNG